jgi:hypothetical protein
MTSQKELKARVRARMARTGESFTTAREQVIRDREATLGEAVDEKLEAVVLKVNQRSARVRMSGHDGEVTLRIEAGVFLVRGHVVTGRITRRWSWRGDAYASGKIDAAVVDPTRLGLPVVQTEELGVRDLPQRGYGRDRRLAGLWRRIGGRARRAYELDAVVWRGIPEDEIESFDEDPVSDAVELRDDGKEPEARQILSGLLHHDLRCIDAHAHLGNWTSDFNAARGVVHYDIGIAIGELALRALPSDALLPWAAIYNRAFLRCLYGRGLALWDLGRHEEAIAMFERVCFLNPEDEQGARFAWLAIQDGWSRADFEEHWEDEEWIIGLRDTEDEPEIEDAGLDSSEFEA